MPGWITVVLVDQHMGIVHVYSVGVVGRDPVTGQPGLELVLLGRGHPNPWLLAHLVGTGPGNGKGNDGTDSGGTGHELATGQHGTTTSMNSTSSQRGQGSQ